MGTGNDDNVLFFAGDGFEVGPVALVRVINEVPQLIKGGEQNGAQAGGVVGGDRQDLRARSVCRDAGAGRR